MNEFFLNSAYFGVVLSLVTYFFGTYIRKKINFPLFNPLLIAIILTAAVLLVFKIDYQVYNASAKYISYLLTPATICLAIPLYEQLELLKKNFAAIMIASSIFL